MMLTITTTHWPATDLGYLLAKHPQRCQTFSLAFGSAHVVYPEASEERCARAHRDVSTACCEMADRVTAGPTSVSRLGTDI